MNATVVVAEAKRDNGYEELELVAHQHVEWAKFTPAYTRAYSGGTQPATLKIRFASGIYKDMTGKQAEEAWAGLAEWGLS